MMTTADPETNILRSAIACFAAAVGGTDSISVLPHTIAHGLPEGFARRVARNTQLVMASESHLDFVADPAAGAGSIEALTDALCERAWAEFQFIEREGGILECLAAGHLQRRIGAASDARLLRYREGGGQIVGATVYQLANERPVETLAAERRPLPTEGAAFCEKLDSLRIEEAIGASS
ncbi:methylmalonyl-CoA mutase family protein [Mesorhizobium marinum]|uniref:methylmalonyl-CoA mutase family protein n=1 Tax=Mesorhizobium marinum TaxID=3228790 RepID=UPI003F5B5814